MSDHARVPRLNSLRKSLPTDELRMSAVSIVVWSGNAI